MAAATESWHPNAAGTSKIVQLLRDTQTADNTQHQIIYKQLEELREHAEFNNYLSYIMASCLNEDDQIRGRAGLMLKNNVREDYENMHPLVREYIKQQALSCIGDRVPFIRQTAGSLVSTIASKGKLIGWTSLLASLTSSLESSNAIEVDGALDALTKICEDCAGELIDNPVALGRPLDVLIPLFVRFFHHSEASHRQRALSACNLFLIGMPDSVVKNIDAFLKSLFTLTQDPTKAVRKELCHSLCILLEVGVAYIMPFMRQIIEFMLTATKDEDESVSLEACEFWPTYCSSHGTSLELLHEYLPVLLPILLDCMVYSDVDLMILGCDEDEDDEDVPDRPEDIRPRFHNPRNQPATTNDSDTDDWDEDDDDAAEWNLRKCSASSLDKLSMTYKDSILPILFPLLQAKLADTQWTVRESAILALGAIAEGCFAGLTPHLSELVPYLIKLLLDLKPLIRSITCWTLSRFSNWILAQNDDNLFFKPLMEAILGRVLDKNKRVQEAACSAFATLEEEARLRLVPYLKPIVQSLMFAFHKYQAKNKLILYDAIGTLAESVGGHLAQTELVEPLMVPLMHELELIRNDDRNIFPLLECLAYVAQALSHAFKPFAPAAVARCLAIIQENLGAQQLAQQASASGLSAECPDKEFIVCALDLLSGISEALEGAVESLLTGTNLFPLLYACTKDANTDVRQSAIALLGDLASHAPALLRPHLEQFMLAAAENLQPQFVAVCNNASWAIGEMARGFGNEVRGNVVEVLGAMIPLLNSGGLEARLLDNLSITIGRMVLVCPDLLAPFLPQFCRPWCFYLSRYQEDEEKAHAFRGLCLMGQANPQAVLDSFAEVCSAIASWQSPPQELGNMFGQLLHQFKANLAPQNQWAPLFHKCPTDVQAHLQRLYRL